MVKIKVKVKYVKGETVLVNVEKNKYIPAKITKIEGNKYFVKYVENDNIEKYGNNVVTYSAKDIKKYPTPEKIVPYNAPRNIPPPISPVFWVLKNNKKFPAWINKTFIKYKLTNKTDITSVDNKFKPFLYQLFLRDYMQNASPYRGILLYHGLGSGKTCTAITIAESLKMHKNIVVISPASLKDNFIGDENTGLLFCGDPQYKKNPQLIKEKYTFVSSNASNTIKQLNSIPSLDNHVIIMDEAHNLVSRMVGGLNGDNKQGKQIYDKLMNARDCKIVALTGTPIVNNIYEAAILLNVLNGYIYISVFKIIHVDPKYGINWNLQRLEDELEKLEGVDYLEIIKTNQTIEFHLTVKPWHEKYKILLANICKKAKEYDVDIDYLTFKQYTLFPDESDEVGFKEFNKYFVDTSDPNIDRLKNVEILQRRIIGLISYYRARQENFPTIKKNEFVEVYMSHYQFREYERVREEEKRSKKLAEIRVFSRQYCNFVFPPEIPRPGIGEKIIASAKKNENVSKVMAAAESEEQEAEVKKEELKKYQRAIDQALKKLSENADKYLVISKLGTYSNKMKAMLENINASSGLVFVYSDFRSLEGVEIFSRVLMANGYAPLTSTDNKPKFALYTGSEDFAERTAMLKIFNDPDNKYGKNIKIILATSAGAEGLDLKNIRQVHIMEPYWNEVRIQQVIGRAVRRNSHIHLPKNERNVSIFRYMSLISPEDKKTLKPKDRLSTDQIVLDIARKKETITREMLHLMKECAVDCVLNAFDTEGNITCFNFGEKAEGIAFVPRLGKNVSRGVEEEMRKVEHKLRAGAIDYNNLVYFIENKKVYKATDKLRKNPIVKLPKFKKKIALDLDSGEIYDYDAAMKSKTKVKLGNFNNKSEFYKK